MIGKLSGRVDTILENGLILDVQGVGYVVHASTRTLSRLGGKDSAASLLIDTHVREDAISLYGFADATEQRWFRLLTSVQGVGAKVGLSILSTCPPEKLQIAIAAQDKAALTQADGVGPKLGTRIVTELKDKVEKGMMAPAPTSYKEIKQAAGNHALDDAVSALVNLGYGRSEAYAAVLRVQEEANDNLQILIKLALKALSA